MRIGGGTRPWRLVHDFTTRRFNTEAANLGDATVLTVSVDLPFTQAEYVPAVGEHPNYDAAIEAARGAADNRLDRSA